MLVYKLAFLYFFIAFRRNIKTATIASRIFQHWYKLRRLLALNWIAYMRALIKRTTNWWNFHVTFSSPPQPYKWKHSSPVSKRLNDTEVLSLSNHFTYNYLVTELSWYEYIFLCIYIHSLNGCDFYSSSRGRSNVYGKANESARICWNDNWKPQTATITTT